MALSNFHEAFLSHSVSVGFNIYIYFTYRFVCKFGWESLSVQECSFIIYYHRKDLRDVFSSLPFSSRCYVKI